MQNITCSTTNVLHCDSLWRDKQKRVTESCQLKIIIMFKKQKCAAYKFVKALSYTLCVKTKQQFKIIVCYQQQNMTKLRIFL